MVDASNEAFKDAVKQFRCTLVLLSEFFGSPRDGVLSILSISYALGYIIWSYNAWKNNLGSLPLLDSQYLLAGGIPVIIILSYFVYRYLDVLVDLILNIWFGFKYAITNYIENKMYVFSWDDVPEG